MNKSLVLICMLGIIGSLGLPQHYNSNQNQEVASSYGTRPLKISLADAYASSSATSSSSSASSSSSSSSSSSPPSIYYPPSSILYKYPPNVPLQPVGNGNTPTPAQTTIVVTPTASVLPIANLTPPPSPPAPVQTHFVPPAIVPVPVPLSPAPAPPQYVAPAPPAPLNPPNPPPINYQNPAQQPVASNPSPPPYQPPVSTSPPPPPPPPIQPQPQPPTTINPGAPSNVYVSVGNTDSQNTQIQTGNGGATGGRSGSVDNVNIASNNAFLSATAAINPTNGYAELGNVHQSQMNVNTGHAVQHGNSGSVANVSQGSGNSAVGGQGSLSLSVGVVANGTVNTSTGQGASNGYNNNNVQGVNGVSQSSDNSVNYDRVARGQVGASTNVRVDATTGNGDQWGISGPISKASVSSGNRIS